MTQTLDTNEIEQVVRDLGGWMVTYGPLSPAAEMSLKEIMCDLDGGIEITLEDFEKIKNNLEAEIEALERDLSSDMAKELVERRKEIKELGQEITDRDKQIEHLEISVNQVHDKLKAKEKEFERRLKELEQDVMSAAW